MSAAGKLARVALALAAIAGLGDAAWAQDVPNAISPIQVQSDGNGVNLTDGRIAMDMPALTVPGAPNLRYDRVQNAAPYIRGNILVPPGNDTDHRFYAVHTGGGTSDSFECWLDSQCVNLSGSGSTFNWRTRTYRQSGSGTVWQFGLLQTSTPTQVYYYGTSVTHPNGEVIIYTYQNLGAYRPVAITSSLGYTIALSYQGDDYGGDPAAWASVAQATLYASAAPTVPLGRLTYSGATIVDHGNRAPTDPAGRTYTCSSCGNGMGGDTEVNAGSIQLPGEAAPTFVVASTAGQGGTYPIQTVTRDGVAWTYSYAGLAYQFKTYGYTYAHLTVTGPNGYHNVYDFGAAGKPDERHNVLSGATDSLGRSIAYVFDETRPISAVYPEGNRVDLTYDSYGNITARTTTPKPGSGQSAIVETASYPAATCATDGIPTIACWRPSWSRDAMGRQSDYSYNSLGQVTEQLDPADANGVRRRTTIVYALSTNGISRRTAVRICADTGASCTTGAPIQTTYDYSGRGDSTLPAAVTQVDGTGALAPLTTNYTYDAAGRVTMTDGPLGGTDDAIYNRYDVYGRKTWEIGALGANGLRMATRTTYRDSDDKVLYTESGTIPAWDSFALTVISRTDMTYDGHRNPIRTAVTAGGSVQSVSDSSYSDRGQVECTAVRMNPAVFGSLPASACTLSTAGSQGSDRITHNIYDAAGQMTQVQRAYGTSLQQNYATYTYSSNGKQTSVTDANGNRAEMTYDGFDRQRRWVFPSITTPGTANAADYEEYGYDAAGNRTSLRKRDGSTLTFSYDNLNRVLVKTVPERSGLAATHTRDVYYGYDLGNRQLFARFDSATGEGVVNAYDGFGRLISSTLNMDGVSRTIASVYREDGARTRVTHPDGQAFTYAYSPAGELTGVYQGTGTGTPLDTFTYNTQSQLAARSEGPGTSSVGYTYDAPGRLASITDAFAGGTGNVALTFGYNAASQITSRTRNNDAYAWTGAYAVNRNYTVNGLNQYTAAGGASFGYDANGNLTSDGSNTYVYDIENRLVAASGGHTATLRYDPLGRLYEVAGTSSTTRFLYDGDALVAEYSSAGALTARYVHGSNAGADDPLIWHGSGVTHWLHADHQGSIVAMTNSSGVLSSINAYDEWGIPNATNQGRFQYTGQEWIGELGLYYYKARVYSPTLGRFLQTDPIGYDGGVNLYAYVGDDPVNITDFDGKDPRQAVVDAVWDFFEPLSHIPGDIIDLGRRLADGRETVGSVLNGLPPTFGGGVSGAPVAAGELSALVRGGVSAENATVRANQIHGELDALAQTRRTTAVLETNRGSIVAGGGRDLNPAQIRALGPGEAAARAPGAHAEATALREAQARGASPRRLNTSRPMCDDCQAAVRRSGGTVTSPTTAVWRPWWLRWLPF
jgi:RHS repeat-associated protein